jgi:hypothetical protein
LSTAPAVRSIPAGTPVVVQTQAAPSLLERILPPLAWVAVGFAVGYYQGNQSGKKKGATHGGTV